MLILEDLKEKRGYWKLREEALDRTLWRTRLFKRLWYCREMHFEKNEFISVPHMTAHHTSAPCPR